MDNTAQGANGQYSVSYVHDTQPSRAYFDESDAVFVSNQFTWTASAYPIEIHDDALTYSRLRVFEISPTSTTIPGYGSSNLARYVGYLDVKGLFSYITVAAHEQGHVDSYATPYQITNNYFHPPFINRAYFSTGNHPDLYAPGSDDGAVGADGMLHLENSHPDHLWDGWEFLHHMNPDSPATVGADVYRGADPITGQIPLGDTSVSNSRSDPSALGNFDVVDDEVLADLKSLGAVFANIGNWQLDWSDQGVNVYDVRQGLNSGAPDFVTHPLFQKPAQPGQPLQPPTFYLVFHPVFYPDPNGGAVISPDGTGSPVIIDEDEQGTPYETWAIRNLADLQALFPGVLTQLGDLDRGPAAVPNS